MCAGCDCYQGLGDDTRRQFAAVAGDRRLRAMELATDLAHAMERRGLTESEARQFDNAEALIGHYDREIAALTSAPFRPAIPGVWIDVTPIEYAAPARHAARSTEPAIAQAVIAPAIAPCAGCRLDFVASGTGAALCEYCAELRDLTRQHAQRKPPRRGKPSLAVLQTAMMAALLVVALLLMFG
jgi:hypothetical protein